ncbi:hypothetical protein TSUD_44450 [Trifolium subterraneum]|uniref:Uncharacterized protein n=1 Tax=Trifolium subterraneum TaxID=3900 RepID=A0A2Z6N6H6_TRISU|nr:hypothetical protein TSUD_44450 [Trifolium subterraneum]
MERYYKFVLFFLVFIEIAQTCLCANSHVPCIEQERQALLHFKASLSQDSPNKLSSWKGTHCCQWKGINCDNVTGHVIKLDLMTPCNIPFRPQQGELLDYLSYNSFGATMDCFPVVAPNISSSLLQLEHLTYLDLTGNNFSESPIPMFIGSMGRLEYLSLSGACFSGMIPNSIENLKNLHFLDLSFNNYVSYNPEFVVMRELQMNDDIRWISKLHSLKHLDLSYVRLTEIHNLFQVLNTLPSLLHLSLHYCGIDNSLIPRYALQNMTSLVYLDLSWNELYGPFPESFQNMTSIESLYLSYNSFTFIPTWFSDFEKLTLLDLSYNGLHGPISEAFRNMTSIESLYLSSNNFTLVPWWFCNFEKLTLLDLSENSLTSIPPQLSELKRLVHLNLESNQLTLKKCFVSSIITNMCRLKELDLSQNKLQGELMGHFELSGCNTYDLERLDLEDNGITDRLPTWLGQLENLKYLYFGSNLLHGPIPLSMRKLSKLEWLDLSNNLFEEVLSSNIGLPVNLTYLDLSSNKFYGSIPQSLCNLENLSVLDLSKNSFTGLIPESISQLVDLQELDLSNNSFNGSIPESISQLLNLEILGLSSNKFNGSIPQSLGKLGKLYSLDLSNNSFNGIIPESFGQLFNLQYIDISSNKLDGIMPMKKGCLLNLRYLNLSHNQIRGSLPKNIGHIMLSLENLFLENNHLNGSIPTSLCQCQLINIDISKNNLSGKIPNCWEDNEGWSEINFSFNKLTGAFPSSFGNLSSLFWLHLNNNSLQGELPMSFRNLKQLLILDLGENQLSGSIPSSWTTNTFPLLQVLRLRQNMLSGSIPSQLCQLKSLKILDLSKNKLQGSIPRCIGNLEGMTLEKSISSSVHTQSYRLIAEAPQMWSNEILTEVHAEPPTATEFEWSTQDVTEVVKGMELEYTKILKLVVNMDLSENNLVGSIPNEITWLTGLHGLNLSNNQLKGEIPQLIGDMKSLESLDMSHNQLSGRIPETMSALTSLSHLNLSHNNLSGPIPKDNQFLTLDDPSIYDYNPYLCGFPLPMCPGDILHGTSERKGDEDEDVVEKVLFYFVIALGFATGLWGFIGTLWFKKNWRHAYFRRVEDVADKIYVAFVIKVPKIKKKMMRNHVNG